MHPSPRGRVAFGAALVLLAAVPRAAGAAAGQPPLCPRPAAGSEAVAPRDLRSEHGVLRVTLTERNERAADGSVRYCYLLDDGSESPTLRLHPGDELVLSLRNALADLGGPAPPGHRHPGPASADPCTSGAMTAVSANLHFHGLTLPPVCHQDEVLRTSVQPGDPPFEYRVRIPDDAPPGLYWYHPHIHGFSAPQVLGGASGALIVEGIERAVPELAGLPERVLVIRDQALAQPGAASTPGARAAQALLDRDGDAANTGTGAGQPAKDLSVNFVPVPFPEYPVASVTMRTGQRELWRVVNASSVTYLDLAALYRRGAHFRPEWLGVVAIDGAPLTLAPGARAPQWRNSIVVSPGSRVEFILEPPPGGVPAMLVTHSVNTGEAGENDPQRPLLTILSRGDAAPAASILPARSEPLPPPRRPWLGSVAPVRTRKLYFLEDTPDPAKPASGQRFFLTVEGQVPTPFDPSATTPNIVVHQGDVEDWIIENRTSELHAFHIHQVHFEVLEWAGFTLDEPFLRDTINVPFFSASTHGFPTVKLRMDFRDPGAVGTFVYHCHLLDHEDGGMMGLIQVLPAQAPAASTSIAR